VGSGSPTVKRYIQKGITVGEFQMPSPVVASLLTFLLAAGLCLPVSAQDNGLVLYGAGGLREAMTEIAAAFTRERGVAVRTQFGASGRLRERIEAGDKVDVFTSADIGHAAKLVSDGRASVMAMFARNELCLLSPAARAPAGPSGVLDALLADGAKVGVSPARIDPLGDYPVLVFDMAEKLRPGSGQMLRGRAVVLDNPPGAPSSPSGDYYLDAIRDGRITLAIVYCSGKGRYARIDPGLVMTPFPPGLATGPQYGLAVMQDARPESLLLALAILSPLGQKILAANGFRPVTAPDL
jgi:molybdate transport system substrate-binding protein